MIADWIFAVVALLFLGSVVKELSTGKRHDGESVDLDVGWRRSLASYDWSNVFLVALIVLVIFHRQRSVEMFIIGRWC